MTLEPSTYPFVVSVTTPHGEAKLTIHEDGGVSLVGAHGQAIYSPAPSDPGGSLAIGAEAKSYEYL